MSKRKIELLLNEISFETFCEDRKTIDAVLRNLEIIGEASNQIPKELQNKYSDIPWKIIIEGEINFT